MLYIEDYIERMLYVGLKYMSIKCFSYMNIL